MARRLNAELLKKALKKRWEKINSKEMKCDMDNSKIKGEKSREYYFEDLNENLVHPMSDKDKEDYGGGAGQELEWKMKAIHSSSAMTYNIFSNNRCAEERKVSIEHGKKLPEGEYDLKYEEKLKALTAPANLDVYLHSKEKKTILLFEMKMTEWLLHAPSRLSESYDPQKLRDTNAFGKLTNAFADLIDEYIEKDENGKNIIIQSKKNEKVYKYYKCKTNHFDAFQIIKHMMGIYNGLNSKSKYTLPNSAKKVHLVIGYWTIPNDNTFLKEAKIDYETYKKDIEGSDENPKENTMRYEIKKFTETLKELKIKDLFWDKYEVTFDVKALTVKEIVDCLDKKENDLNALMKRYL